MEIENFSVIEVEFHARVRKIVWCSMATVDRAGRPRQRIMHPIWEGQQGWVATNRHSHKEKHLAKTPYVSLSYWDQDHELIYADCKAEWIDDQPTKTRIWELYKSTPEPLGYDPVIIWPDGPESPDVGILALTPFRITLSSLAEMRDPRIWRSPQAI